MAPSQQMKGNVAVMKSSKVNCEPNKGLVTVNMYAKSDIHYSRAKQFISLMVANRQTGRQWILSQKDYFVNT